MLAGADADTANRLLGTRMLRAIRGVQTRRRIHGRGEGGWETAVRCRALGVIRAQLGSPNFKQGTTEVVCFFSLFSLARPYSVGLR